jgi:hypothetical protein
MFCFVPELWADKCGTFGNRYDATIKAIQKGERILKPDLPFSYVSNNNHFRVHYTLSGSDAVDSVDLNRNGIPDYVDATAETLEYTYTIQIDSMGFPSPPNNGENGMDPYDVYLIDLSKQGYYGLTTSELSLPGSTNQHRYTLTYIELDNNYSKADKTGNGSPSFNTFELDALKITAAHEFQHAIHLANYGMNDQLYDVSLYEMFCTWIEAYHYPEIKDYHYYVKNFFLQPKEYRFGQRYSTNVASGYANALFFEYLHEKSKEKSLGFRPLLDFWVNIDRMVLPYRALELSLAYNGLPLHELWCGYLERVYHTGKRAQGKDPRTLFNDAESFPLLNMDTATANPEAVFTGFVFPYEIMGLASPLSTGEELTDTTHVLISPAYADWFSIIGDQEIAYIVKANNNTSININVNSVPYCSLNRLSQGRLFLPADKPYPNPVVLSKHSKLSLSLPNSVQLGDDCQVNIFTVNGTPVYSFTAKAQIDEQNKSRFPAVVMVVTLEDITVLDPAVYIFTVSSKGAEISGKFAVKP